MSTGKQRIHLSIGFGDTVLPVIGCDDGHDRVPFKPVADQIGLDWKTQKRKVLSDDYLRDRIGLFLGEASLPQLAQLGIKKDQYLIRVDRVTAFLNSLNPRMIRASGNEEAADWLKAKHAEWDDALHAYETKGVAVKTGQSAQLDQVIKLARLKHAADVRDRRWIDHLLQQQLAQLDVPAALYTDPQPQLPLAANPA